MQYSFTRHARQRMAERAISKQFVEQSLRNPTKLLYDKDSRLLFKKLYSKNKTKRLLLVAAERIDDHFKNYYGH